MDKKLLHLLVTTIIFLNTTIAQSTLEQCHKKQVPTDGKYLKLDFRYDYQFYGHYNKPFKTLAQPSDGRVWVTADSFHRSDTTYWRGKEYYQKFQYANGDLLNFENDTAAQKVKELDWEQFVVSSAKYNPALIIHTFLQKKEELYTNVETDKTIYAGKIYDSEVTLTIDHSDSLLKTLEVLHYDPFHGDVVTKLSFTHYAEVQKLSIPQDVIVSSYGGRIIDSLKVSSYEIVDEPGFSLEKPENYEYTPKPVTSIPEFKISKYNDYIYFFEFLGSVDNRSLIIEFDEYFIVARAPIRSELGEVIIDEVKKINSSKPIKYFLFGHHHQWGIGGVRPFIQEGSSIITEKEVIPYLEYVGYQPHSLNPDSQSLNQKKIKTVVVEDSLTLSDENHSITFYPIGSYTHHTDDFLITYFPDEKMVFEDDLVWIKETGKGRASKRQIGFYNAINDLNLEVETVVQSWPLYGYGYKNIISYQELMDSIENP